jgi:hypothetical protein
MNELRVGVRWERRDMWEEEYEMRITWLPFGDMVSHVLIASHVLRTTFQNWSRG